MGRNCTNPPSPDPPNPWTVRPLDRRDWFLLILVTLFALGMRGWRLDQPREKYFDEIYYTVAAQDYLSHRPDSNTVHPPLAKIHLAAGMLLADRLDAWLGPGDDLPDTAEWRVGSLVSGTLIVPLTFLLGFRMSRGNRSVATCASFLVAIDFMSVTISRICMLDMVLCLWMMVGLYCAWRYLEESEAASPQRWHWATMAGLAFGAATACKWNGLFGAFGACLAMVAFGGPRNPDVPVRRQDRALGWLGPPVLMALTIPVVYVLSYGFLFHQEGTLGGPAWEKIYGFHKLMVEFRYDAGQFHHQYLSYFWEWPLVLRPIWLYYEAEQGRVAGIVAFGSVVFWWTGLLYVLELGFNAVSTRDRVCGFLALTWGGQWLLWAASTTGGFIYYVLPGVPMLALATALVLNDWLASRGRWLAVVYLGVLAGLFVAYFPFLTALPASQEAFDALFPTWAGRWR